MHYLTTHPSLVPGILKSCNLPSYHAFYLDYQQEAYLILWQLWQQHAPNTAAFEKVAFTFTRCRLLDLIRRAVFLENKTESLSDTWDLPSEAVDELVFTTFLTTLTPFEKDLCLALCEEENLTQVAKQLQVSRNRVYRHLTSLKEKAKKFFK